MTRALAVGILGVSLGASSSWGRSGPVSDAVPDCPIDLSTDASAFALHIDGDLKAKCRQARNEGVAGMHALIVEQELPSANGRVHLRWKVDQAGKDWSGVDGIMYYYKVIGDGKNEAARIYHEIVNGKNLEYKRGARVSSKKDSGWQLVMVPFYKPVRRNWVPLGKVDDADRYCDFSSGVRTLDLSVGFNGEAGKTVEFAISGLGFYRERKYDGPVLRLISSHGNTILPGESYRIWTDVSALPKGASATLELAAEDQRGLKTFELRHEYKLDDGGILADEANNSFHIPSGGPGGYARIKGVLKVNGKPVYQDELALACLLPMETEDTAPNPDSIFGFWPGPGSLARPIGSKWMRVRITLDERGTVIMDDGAARISAVPPGFEAIALAGPNIPKSLWHDPKDPGSMMMAPKDWEAYKKHLEPLFAWCKERGIYRYEVVNEPNFDLWKGSVEDLVKLHEAFSEVAHRIQPEAVVMGPCLPGFFFDWLEKFFAAGGAKTLDQVVMHTYGDSYGGKFIPNMRKFKEMMAKYGLGGKDIYFTECGAEGYGGASEMDVVRFMVMMYVEALSEGVKVLCWHGLEWSKMHGYLEPKNLDDHGFAILRPDLSPTPAYVAYAAMTSILERAKFVGKIQGLKENVRGYSFEKRGRQIMVLWRETGDMESISLEVPAANAAPRVELIDALGRTVQIKMGKGKINLELGRDPVYVVAYPSAK
ncbi:MAG: hypothetical protein WAX69_03580 [Victivallales bacterium]